LNSYLNKVVISSKDSGFLEKMENLVDEVFKGLDLFDECILVFKMCTKSMFSPCLIGSVESKEPILEKLFF